MTRSIENVNQPAEQLVAEILVGEESVSKDVEKFQVKEKDGQSSENGSYLAVKLLFIVGDVLVITDGSRITHPPQPKPHAVKNRPEVALHLP